MSDFTFLINAGTEKAVASTKATTAQIAVIILLAYACAGELEEGKRILIDMIGKINDMLNPRYNEHIKKLAEIIHQKENAFIIGVSDALTAFVAGIAVFGCLGHLSVPTEVATGESRRFRLGILESAGQAGEVRIEWGGDLLRAQAIDSSGRPLPDVHVAVDGRSTVLWLAAYQWLHLELEFVEPLPNPVGGLERSA